MTAPKFIFIGGTFRGYKLFQKLVSERYIPLYAVILKEDSHEIDKQSENIVALANANNIPNRLRKKLQAEDIAFISSQIFDFAIVCGWRTLIPLELDQYFKIGMLAAHDSLLPKYRGFAPLNWSIINGEKETGVTLFKIKDGETDSGDIFKQSRVPILDNEYAIEVYQKIVDATVEVYFSFLDDFMNHSITASPQNELNATYTCKRLPSDGRINWHKTSTEVFNLIRGLAHPYPGAYCIFNDRTYHVRKAMPGDNANKTFVGNIPGRVISVKNDYIEVLCEKGTLNIYEWEDKERNSIESPAETVRSITSTLL